VNATSSTSSRGEAPPTHPLRDAAGRLLEYLRLSITDRCNFRCVYCLPQGCPKRAGAEPLSLEEFGRLVRAFASLGFWKIRLTGGEPLLREDVCEIVRRVARTPGVRRVGLTTNGCRLAAVASELRDAGLTSLNVSIDSLDPERFRSITGSVHLPRIIAGVDAALAAGIPSVKVNAVLMRGMAPRELDHFLAWTEQTPLVVRFIELMETGDNSALFLRSRLPAEVVREELLRRGWTRLPRDPGDGPATNYGHPAHAGKVGLISAYTPGFCAACNRLRVSSTGELRPCLFGEHATSLRRLLGRDEDLGALVRLIESSVTRKPQSHRLHERRCGFTPNLAATGG
jgi:cyclic pyranopterin phosphate synthase